MALTEKQQEKVQVCVNKLVRRIVGAKRVDKRTVDELRVEIGVKKRLKKKSVRSRLIRTVHVDRMGYENMAKRPNAQKLEWKRRRGRPKLWWG